MVDFVSPKDDNNFVNPQVQNADNDSIQRYLNQKPTFTGAQSIGAAFDLGSEGIATSIGNMIGMSQVKDFAEQNPFPKKSVEELNKQYPGLPNPFTEPTDPFVAGEIARRQTEKMQLQRAVELGPQDPIYKVGRFGAGMLAGSLDPFFAGAAIATGGLAEVALGTKLAPGILRTAVSGAMQGAASSVIAEPFKAIADSQENQPWNYKDGISRVAEGAASFAILNSAHAMIHRLLSPEQVKMIDNVTKNQLANDKVPNVDPLIKDFATEKSGYINPESGITNKYVFNKLDDPNGLHFYIPKDSVQMSSKDGGHLPIGQDLGGGGVYMTDNPHVANGYATPKTQGVPGSIHEVSFEGKNIEKLGEAPSEKFMEATKVAAEEQGIKLNNDFKSGNDILEAVKSEIYNNETPYGEANSKYNSFLKTLQDESQSKGIDGYHFEVSKTGPIEHNPYNSVYLFDRDVKEHGGGLANPESVYKPDPKDAHEILDKTLKPFDGTMFHDPDAQNKFDSSISTSEVKAPELTDIEKEVQQHVDSLKNHLEMFPDDKEAANLLEEFKQIDSDARDSENILRKAFDCFLSKGSG